MYLLDNLCFNRVTWGGQQLSDEQLCVTSYSGGGRNLFPPEPRQALAGPGANQQLLCAHCTGPVPPVYEDNPWSGECILRDALFVNKYHNHILAFCGWLCDFALEQRFPN